MLTRRSAHGEPLVSRYHRSASAPTRSITSMGSMTLPRLFDIFLPSASTISPRHTTFR